VRIAATNARKIQAALRQGIDAKRVLAAYRKTQPNVSKNPVQDRARARAWAMLNMRINNEPLLEVLQRTWAEGFVLGQAYGDEEIQRAREAKKAASDYVDWDNWKPGDAATATLLRPPKAFEDLLGKARVTIKDLDVTGYDRVGTALADSIEQGLSDTRAAKLINDAIGSPSRALTIAITETNRAMSYGAITRYQAAKLEQMEWSAVSTPCPKCAMNSGQVIDIGGTFNSGAQMPPAHPHCRCALLPVIPEFEPNANGVVDIAPATGAPMPYSLKPTKMTNTFDDRFGSLPEDQKLIAEDILNKAYVEVAEQPVRINLNQSSLEGVIEDGRFKSAYEKTGPFGGAKNIDSEYMQRRIAVETESMGIPRSVKPAKRPIYGSIAGEGNMYGDIQVQLKETVKGRTSMTLGDSFIEQNPVLIQDVLSGNITREALAQASPLISTNGVIGNPNSGLSGMLRRGDLEPEVIFDRFKKSQTYWEVQIHGGVSLDDIESVILPSLPDGKWGGFTVDKDGQWGGPLIDKLQDKGIKIVQPKNNR
jgi:SPP1 gp7 family putative phage head morphogenesis protein